MPSTSYPMDPIGDKVHGSREKSDLVHLSSDRGKTGSIVAAFSTVTENEVGERSRRGTGRTSRSPISMDRGLLNQFRAVLPFTWTEKTVEDLQAYITIGLSDIAKTLKYLKFNGQEKHISVSGSKTAVIGRILAWQEAIREGRMERKRKEKELVNKHISKEP